MCGHWVTYVVRALPVGDGHLFIGTGLEAVRGSAALGSGGGGGGGGGPKTEKKYLKKKTIFFCFFF